MYSIVVRSRTALVASAKENKPAPSMKENATGKEKSTLNKSGGPRRPTSVWAAQQLRRFSDKLRLVGVPRARLASERKTIYESPSDASTIKNISSTPLVSPMLPASTSGACMMLDTLGSLFDMHDAALYPETEEDGTLAAGTSCHLIAGFLSYPERTFAGHPPPTLRLPSTPRCPSTSILSTSTSGASMLLDMHGSLLDMRDAALYPEAEDHRPLDAGTSCDLLARFLSGPSRFAPPPSPRLPSTPRFGEFTPLAQDSGLPRDGSLAHDRILFTPPPTPRLPSTSRFDDSMLFPRLSSTLRDIFAGRSSLPTPPPTPRLPSTPRFEDAPPSTRAGSEMLSHVESVMREDMLIPP